jgi:hypothetical protein
MNATSLTAKVNFCWRLDSFAKKPNTKKIDGACAHLEERTFFLAHAIKPFGLPL